MGEEPIFVGGLMKSGTSLLRKILCRHPHIFGGLETHWFLPEILVDWQKSDSIRQKWLRQFFEVPIDEVELIKSRSHSGEDFFNRFMAYCTDRAGKKRWLEKTPDNIKKTDLIWKIWSDAIIIHVVRDYRDVYASWKRNKKQSLPDFLQHVHTIMARIGKLAGNATKLYYEVIYDDLVTEPETTLREVLIFLNEPWVGGLDKYQGYDEDYKKVLEVTGKKSPTTESLRKPIFINSIGQWKRILDADEISTIEKELGKYMAIWDWK